MMRTLSVHTRLAKAAEDNGFDLDRVAEGA